LTINALAAELVMDRTTLGRNILPLEREGMIKVGPGQTDKRRKELRLTALGSERLAMASARWQEAQVRFEQSFGADRARELRGLLHDVATEPALAN
jgi:DNA-binding MarR family transcriptional regulator